MKIFSYILFFGSIFWIQSINGQNEKLSFFTSDDGVPTSKLTDIIQDNVGYIWLASSNNGVTRFDGTSFVNYTTKNGLASNTINALAIKNDSLLIASDNGLSIKFNHKTTIVKSPELLDILVVKNKVFLATKQGIYQLKGNSILPLKIINGIDLNHINTLQFDGQFYWIGTKTALWRVHSLTNPKLIKKINNGNYTSIICKNKLTIAATYLKGIKLISNGKIVKKISTVKHINSMSLVNNQLWVTTEDNGIEILNATDFSFERKINKYNENLKSNQVQQVFIDRQLNKWILSKNLYVFTSEEKSTQKPQLFFDNIAIAYQPLDSINVNSYSKILQLQPSQNQISFSLATVDINHPKSIEYRWKLNGEFSPWSRNTTINFANLKSGNYTFIAQSRNATQEISNSKQFSFFIDIPLYKKGWFQLALLSFIVLLITVLILLNIKKIKRKNKEKVAKLQIENHLLNLEQRALQLQMNPHFIFNVLNGIKALGNSGSTKELNSTISKFATLLRSILHNSRQEEISLSQEIATLKNYIELEQQMNTKPFNFSIKTTTNNIDLEEILIPPMLVQPFVENSIKHGISTISKQGNVTILFEIKYNFLHCTITDNGVGFHHSKTTKTTNHSSVALEVTKERIQNLSNIDSYKIEEITEDKAIKGTKVWFKVPLKVDY